MLSEMTVAIWVKTEQVEEIAKLICKIAPLNNQEQLRFKMDTDRLFFTVNATGNLVQLNIPVPEYLTFKNVYGINKYTGIHKND